jgi:hypothetical protein
LKVVAFCVPQTNIEINNNREDWRLESEVLRKRGKPGFDE